MIVFGVVGGVASGKSLVARQLQELGAQVLDADQIGHEVLRRPEVEAALRARWGEQVFDESGRVNRKQVAQIVFGPPPQGPLELAFLESVTHPLIGDRLAEQLAALRAGGRTPAVVLDAALLFRGGWNRLCNRVLFVEAPLAARLARAQARGWSAQDLAARENAQEPLEEKRRRAHDLIDNSGTPEATRAQVQRIWLETVGAAGARG